MIVVMDKGERQGKGGEKQIRKRMFELEKKE